MGWMAMVSGSAAELIERSPDPNSTLPSGEKADWISESIFCGGKSDPGIASLSGIMVYGLKTRR
jgi:hypothetical protein